MISKNKLLLIESEMIEPRGHFLDYLLETSNYFKEKKNIFWFLNKNFKTKNMQLPNTYNIKRIISSNKFKRKENKFFYLMEEIFFFLKNFYDIIYFIIFFIKNNKKLFYFLKCLFLNNFIVPRYFKSFYLNYIKLNFNSKDDILFQSCRRKDIALIFFLYYLEKEQIPKIHIRIFHLPKKKFKDFYFYLDKIKKTIEKRVFIYTEEGYKKKFLTKELGKKFLVHSTKPIFSFYNRDLNLINHTIGFVGEARINKGFKEIPKFIEIINKYNKNINFIIQFSNVDDGTQETVNHLHKLSLKYKNIQIINKYCDYNEYRSILKKITIMPLLYDLKQIKIGSGVLYSCISHEIIPIVPKNCDYLKEILSTNSYLEASDIDCFANNSLIILNDYKNYLIHAKNSSKNLFHSIEKDFLINNLSN